MDAITSSLLKSFSTIHGLDEEKAPPKLVQRFKDELNFLENYCKVKKIQL